MGYNHLFEWGTTLEDLIYTLCLQGKRLVAKTPPCDVSRHRKLVNPRGAGFLGLVVACWVEGELA